MKVNPHVSSLAPVRNGLRVASQVLDGSPSETHQPTRSSLMKLSRNGTALVLAACVLASISAVVSKPLNQPVERTTVVRATVIVPRLPFCSNRALERGEIKKVCVATNDIFLLALLAAAEAQVNR